MKKLLFFIAALSILYANQSVAEEEISVNVKADKLKYIEGTNIVIAAGSAEVKIEEVTISADKLTMNTKTKVVTAEGNVKIRGLQYDAACSSMTYNVNDETSVFNGFSTVLSPSNVKGLLFLKAQNLDDKRKEMKGTEGKATTCDYSRPHYFTAGHRIEYYPDDKIIGYSVTFYVLDAPILWVPYFMYDLHKRNKKNWVFGHNNVEGDFIKSAWDYAYGQIYLDEMSKKGFGQGISYDYAKSNFDGSLYLYHIEEADTRLTDWVTKLRHNLSITDKSKLGLNYNSTVMYQVPGGRLDQTSFSANFYHNGDKTVNAILNILDSRTGRQEHLDTSINYRTPSTNTNYSFNFDQGKNEPRYIRLAQRFNHSQNLFSSRTRLNFNASYYDNIAKAGGSGDERLDSNIEITHQEKDFNIRYYESWRLDLDKSLYKGDQNDQYLEAQPEITINPRPLDLKLFNLSSSFAYGWYHEVQYASGISRNRDFSTGRYKMTLNANKTFPLGFGTSLGLTLGLDQFLYDPGDSLNAFREDASLNSQAYDFMRNSLVYARGISDGNSPFFFDKFSTRYHNIRDTLTFYYKSYFNWINTCGYNYETKRYFNYDTNMSYNPAKQLSFSMRSGFDIENQKYLDLSSTTRIYPWDKFSLNLGMVNDLNLGGLKQGNCLVDLEIADEKDWRNHWHFKYGYIYDVPSQNFIPRDIMIVKDLHCWEVKYTYSDYRKEFNLTFTLKAFPGEPLGYSTGKGFYFDGFDKAIKEAKSEFEQPSPTRY